jgi:stringent starvation protein B
MIDTQEFTSTRPYLIRAIYEWCTDNGFTPFISVNVNESVRVPMEFVKNGEIVLNISYDATSALVIGNDLIEFKGRFGGMARDILVPVERVMAIYARENGQGMAFPIQTGKEGAQPPAPPVSAASKPSALSSVSTTPPTDDTDPEPPRSGSQSGSSSRPSLTRVK